MLKLNARLRGPKKGTRAQGRKERKRVASWRLVLGFDDYQSLSPGTLTRTRYREVRAVM